MLDFLDIQQNTDEWLQLRAGRLTSSKLGVIMAYYPKAFGEPAKKYAVNIAVEQITGKPISNSYSNSHMDRGHEQEPIARMNYENELFCDVDNGGFFSNKFLGCSPDGLVGDDGVIEIKSVVASTHFANIKRQGIDPAYKWQCIGNLLFTGRKWLDFISYSAEFPDDKNLFVCRIHAEDLKEEFDSILTRIKRFEILVAEIKDLMLTSNYFLN